MEKMSPEYYVLYGQKESGAFEPPAISEVEKLMNEFEAHELRERSFIQRYKEIAVASKNPLVQFLLRLIISDEEKHHVISHAMVTTLKADLTWTSPEDALRGLYELEMGNDELLKLTEDFIRLEREGIKQYKQLIKTSRGYYRGLFSLLFECMIHDSEKHAEILEFLRGRLRKA